MSNLVLLIVLLAYSGLLVLISARAGKQAGNDAFFTGNRKAPWYVVSIGMIGSSLSGVSFVSVPGMVAANGFLYLQTVLGFFVGYLVLAKVLLPVYYRQTSPSIYVYLDERFGRRTYRTGAWFFLLSKVVGASARVYVAVLVLHEFVLEGLGISFGLTAVGVVLVIWLYTFRNGTRTIVWTDLVQTVFMLGAMVLMLVQFAHALDLGPSGVVDTVRESGMARWFDFDHWQSGQFFPKQFFSGIFIVLVMTGMDQEMIQKNRTIRRLDQARRNMFAYGFAFLPVNLLLLVTGVLMYTFAQRQGISLPESPDAVLPMLATQHFAGSLGTLLLLIGVVSATFSGADSSMTAVTTSFCIDILDRPDDVRTRRRVHVGVALVFVLVLLLFRAFNDTSLLDAVYTLASYTYGPLLGLFAFGLLTRRKVLDRAVPYVALLAPLLCLLLQGAAERWLGYRFSYELLMLNGLITFAGLWTFSRR